MFIINKLFNKKNQIQPLIIQDQRGIYYVFDDVSKRYWNGPSANFQIKLDGTQFASVEAAKKLYFAITGEIINERKLEIKKQSK